MTMLEALKNYLIVSEFMYNHVDPSRLEISRSYQDDDFDWIELHNFGPVPLDLTEVAFANAIDFDFALDVVDASKAILEPGGFAVIAANRDAFALRYGESVEIAGQWCGPFNCKSLSDDGFKPGGEPDAIVLVYRATEPLIEINYRDRGDWPVEPDGNGPTLEVTPPLTLSIFDFLVEA